MLAKIMINPFRRMKPKVQTNDLLVLSDKFASMFIFLLILKVLTETYSDFIDLRFFYYGTIYGFLISLNQDFQIKNAILHGTAYHPFIGCTLFLNVAGFACSFVMADHFINALLFAFAASGRFELIKYSSKRLACKLQTIVSASFALLIFLVCIPFGLGSIELLSVSYLLFKIIVGEIVLLDLMVVNRTESSISSIKFSKSLLYSGATATFMTSLLPVGAAWVADDQDIVLFSFLAIQRSLSPAQQIGSLTSQLYNSAISLFLQKFWFVIFSGLISVVIYSYLKWPNLSPLNLSLIGIIAAHASLSGSWTLTFTNKGLQHLEFLKILLSLVVLIVGFAIATLVHMDVDTAITASYLAHMFALYVPQFYLSSSLLRRLGLIT